MTLTTRQIGPCFAAEVEGLDLRKPLSPDEVAAVHAGMDEHAVLVFHDQRIDDAEQLAFSHSLGELEHAIGTSLRAPDEVVRAVHGYGGIVLHDVPRRDYQRIEFGIGVDAAANKSLAQRGDLNPNGRMAWTWEVGYKFVLFEGALVRGNASDPLVYHVGFDENYRLVSTELHGEPVDSRTARLDFRVDILRLFQGSATVDMAALPDVKFDRADAALLARNFAAMVTPIRSDAVGQRVGAR